MTTQKFRAPHKDKLIEYWLIVQDCWRCFLLLVHLIEFVMKSLAILFLVSLPLVSVASKCNLPPDLWCSSKDSAERCNVVEQCTSYYNKDASPVDLTLYLESLCPDCKNFISTQLWPTFMRLKDSGIMNLTLVPYGNAHEKSKGDAWEYECQHGKEECIGNLIEACAIHFSNGSSAAAFPFVHCIEASEAYPRMSAKACAEKTSMNYDVIMTCANGDLGNKLMHQLALKTDALKPPHKYVPWITLNGVHTEELQKKAESELQALICKTYTGPKPNECEKMGVVERQCMRN